MYRAHRSDGICREEFAVGPLRVVAIGKALFDVSLGAVSRRTELQRVVDRQAKQLRTEDLKRQPAQPLLYPSVCKVGFGFTLANGRGRLVVFLHGFQAKEIATVIGARRKENHRSLLWCARRPTPASLVAQATALLRI